MSENLKDFKTWKISAHGKWADIEAFRRAGGLTPEFFSPYQRQPNAPKEEEVWSFEGITYGQGVKLLQKLLKESKLEFSIHCTSFPLERLKEQIAQAASIEPEGRTLQEIIGDCAISNHLVKKSQKNKILQKTIAEMVKEKEILEKGGEKLLLNFLKYPEIWKSTARLRNQSLLLKSIKTNLPKLEKLCNTSSIYCLGEDGFYRFYHQSFKVFGLQTITKRIVDLLQEIGEPAGSRSLNPQFMEIISQGTDKNFDLSCNQNWGTCTRPILEAFFHAREMLNFCIKYGKTLSKAPSSLPSGWAAVLYLYNLR